MTTYDVLTALRAAVHICDETGGGATHDAVAARIGVDEELVQRELLPQVAKYFEKVLEGDDGVAVVRQPTAAARQFVGP